MLAGKRLAVRQMLTVRFGAVSSRALEALDGADEAKIAVVVERVFVASSAEEALGLR